MTSPAAARDAAAGESAAQRRSRYAGYAPAHDTHAQDRTRTRTRTRTRSQPPLVAVVSELLALGDVQHDAARRLPQLPRQVRIVPRHLPRQRRDRVDELVGYLMNPEGH